MSSITTIENISSLVLILINAGCGFRILFCVLHIMTGELQEGQQMKKRIIHTIVFLAVANCLGAINAIAQHYWG